MTKTSTPGAPKPGEHVATGHFERNSDGITFSGYIDVGGDRISCRLAPQGPEVLKLDEERIMPPIDHGTFEFDIRLKKER
jgi:hypothetical protein